jgi:RNA polymerase sigma-70 factor, ECF subfamily
VLASLVGFLGDFDLAEEAAQEAFAAAAERWPREGTPASPRAWLMTTARNRAIDRIRRDRTLAAKLRLLDVAEAQEDEMDDTTIPDERLELLFTCCHPALALEAQVALTLRTLGGLGTDEIARAFLVPSPTIGQRISRGKKMLADAGVRFELPPANERTARLGSVLEVIYLIFNEGYSATAGDDWMRPALCAEAMRLARVLAGLMPSEPEVHGLVALLEIQASRSAARTGPNGEPITLLEQDRSRWDRLLITHGLAALAKAEALGGGTYTLQAAIAACHARARTAEETDWVRMSSLYAELAAIAPSPVVELNRAVAVSMADGPAAGLAVLEPLLAEPSLKQYHLLPSVRGDFLAKLGRNSEAKAEFERAAAMTKNERERALLLERAAACD